MYYLYFLVSTFSLQSGLINVRLFSVAYVNIAIEDAGTQLVNVCQSKA